MDGHPSFGYWLRRRRKALDLTQEALAQQVGCSEVTIRKIEADARRRIRSEDFTSILSVMECASEPPRIQFDFVSLTRGLDFVAEVRSECVH